MSFRWRLLLAAGSLLIGPTSASLGVGVPKCWLKYGECLDLNQPPLDMDGKIKPQVNLNVVAAVKDVPNIDQCLR